MAKETITARATMKDGDGNVVRDEEDKTQYVEGSAQYDFGENLEDLIALCNGSQEVVRSNAIANMKVVLQSQIRTAVLAGISAEGLQIKVDSFVPGVAASKSVVDPLEAAANAFETWSPERQQAYLAELAQKVGA